MRVVPLTREKFSAVGRLTTLAEPQTGQTTARIPLGSPVLVTIEPSFKPVFVCTGKIENLLAHRLIPLYGSTIPSFTVLQPRHHDFQQQKKVPIQKDFSHFSKISCILCILNA